MAVVGAAKAGSSVVSSVSGAASVSGTTSVPGSTEREEGEETDKYAGNKCNTEHAMLRAVQGCLKTCLSHISYFRIKVGIINRYVCTIHLPETGKKLRVHLRRGFRHKNR
jgi:hypothetical protein